MARHEATEHEPVHGDDDHHQRQGPGGEDPLVGQRGGEGQEEDDLDDAERDGLDEHPVRPAEPDQHGVLQLEHDPQRGREDERPDRERVLAHEVGQLR